MYVEFLRVRRALIVYAIVIAANVLLVTTSLSFAHVQITGLASEQIHLPLTVLLSTAAFGSLIFGTIVASSLNWERQTLALSWTRPIARERMAAGIMVVDLGAVLAALLITVALGIVPFVTTGFISRVYVDSQAAGAVVLMLGVTAMWYGLVQAGSSWYRGRGGLAVGVSWGLFAILSSLGHVDQLGPLVHELVGVLNYLNPLAYISSYTSHGSTQMVTGSSYFGLSQGVRILITWTIGIAACAFAIVAWKRAEA